MMARRNILAALALIGIGAWYGVMTAILPQRSLPNTPGPSFFPWLITGGLLLLSAGLLVQGIMGYLRETPEPGTGGFPWHAVYALAMFVAYLVALPYAGFLAASVPFFAGLMLLYGGRNPLIVGIAAIGVPVVLFIVFRHGFQILLPRGVF